MTLNDVPIMVCACGKRLRAPGAKPGRLGRCPACGGELRFSEEAPSIAPSEPIEPEGSRTQTATRPKKRKRRKASGSETNIWNGLVAAPSRPESSFRDSLLYPLWGASGISILVFLPPLLWITSIPFITMVIALSGNESRFSLPALLLCIPFFLGFSVVFGYTLLFLGKVAASSAIGEVHHPHLPDWDLSAILFGIGRWVWAGLVGGIIGGLPAVAYWIYCGDIDFFDRMILAELAALGAVYALMGLLAAILYEDILAANPFTVIRAIVTVGWGYARPCLVAGAAVMLVGTLVTASFEVGNPALAAFLFWFSWLAALYLTMVMLRVMGLFYREHGKSLGWFRDRTGWGV